MLTILKGYDFRLYPTNTQKELINKTIGCTRFIYNHFLDEKINDYKKAGKSKTCYDQIKELPALCATNRDNNWMFMGLYEWTISRRSDGTTYAFYVISSGRVYVDYVGYNYFAVRPSFYLNSDVEIYEGNTGTQSDPYRIVI